MQHRARGKEYDELVDEFMTAAQELYGPQVCLQVRYIYFYMVEVIIIIIE